MKILALYGSPRMGGNSELLLDAFLRGAGLPHSAKFIENPQVPGVLSAEFPVHGTENTSVRVDRAFVSSIPISPCRGCLGCVKTGVCVVADYMPLVHELLLAANLVVLSAPIFFYGLPSQTKALIDRCQSLWCRKYFLKLPMGNDRRGIGGQGIFLSVAGTKGKKVFNGARLTVRYFFDAIDVTFSSSLLYREIDVCGQILKHPTALSEAEMLGKSLVWANMAQQSRNHKFEIRNPKLETNSKSEIRNTKQVQTPND